MAGSSKYGKAVSRMVDFAHLDLDISTRSELAMAAEHAVARSTWAHYKSAERMLAAYCKEKSLPLELPVVESTVVGFVHWLGFTKGVKSGTISGYLAGIRMLHIRKGIPAPDLRSDLLKLIVKGKKNMETADKLRSAPLERGPVTPEIMRILKNRIKSWDVPAMDRLTVWAICATLFHGCFRAGELLAKTVSVFDPSYTLLRSDVGKWEDSNGVTQAFQFVIKAPKEDRIGKAQVLDVYRTDSAICPVRACEKWFRGSAGSDLAQPAFRLASGEPVTTKKLNRMLACLLGPVLPGQKISSHSFRIGAASRMGALGLSDTEIKAAGKWSSRAFEGYVRLPRRRRSMATKAWRDAESGLE